MDSSLKHYISKGFELKYVDQLKYKKIFLKTKKDLKKLFE